jgi:hypothetical protein
MKFQSLIAAIMHAGQLAARVLLPGFALVSSICMSLVAGKHTYSATSSAVKVNGAEIRMQVKPEGAENGSYAILPAEIVQNIGKSPAGWDDKGWD